MRLGWKTITQNHGPELILTDTEMHILDKDGQTHVRTIEGDWSCWGFRDDTPYVISSRERASSYLERNEYIVTDADLRIPRCNVKTVEFKQINERKVQPTQDFRGIPDWHAGDWFTAVFIGGFGLFFLLLASLAIFLKK